MAVISKGVEVWSRGLPPHGIDGVGFSTSPNLATEHGCVATMIIRQIWLHHLSQRLLLRNNFQEGNHRPILLTGLVIHELLGLVH